MSNIPLFLGLIDGLDREANSPYSNGPDFGLGLYPNNIRRYSNYRRYQQRSTSDGRYPSVIPLNMIHQDLDEPEYIPSVDNIEKDALMFCLDVTQFKPNELSVKLANSFVTIEGKHEEREDKYGYIQRHFIRRYPILEGFDMDKAKAELSADGILTIEIPKIQVAPPTNERTIDITQAESDNTNEQVLSNGVPDEN